MDVTAHLAYIPTDWVLQARPCIIWTISELYTYTLCKDENECMQINNGPIDDIDSEHNSGELLINNTDDEVNLLTIM